MVLQILQNGYFEKYCENCYEKYTNADYKWCKSCQRSDLKNNYTNWTSGNDKIDDFIQKKQLDIYHYSDIVFEWIPYDQFYNNVKEIGKGGFATVYSAIWKDGPLCFDKKKWIRKSNQRVALKCFYNSQNITDEFLNEV